MRPTPLKKSKTTDDAMPLLPDAFANVQPIARTDEQDATRAEECRLQPVLWHVHALALAPPDS